MNRFKASFEPWPGDAMSQTLEPPVYCPPTPREIEQLKIAYPVLADLMLRYLRAYGLSSLRSLAGLRKVSSPVVHNLFEQMLKQNLLEVKGTAGLDYSFTLTDAGRKLAAERSEHTTYTGPAPVSLDDYAHAVRTQVAKISINRTGLRNALSDLVVPESLLDQLGPALISQRSLFLYGPSGTGKTSYSERLTRIHQDSVVIAYSVEIDGQIMTVYDPAVHERLPFDDPNLDPRWVVCRRPCITAGGELVSNM